MESGGREGRFVFFYCFCSGVPSPPPTPPHTQEGGPGGAVALQGSKNEK